MSEKEQKRSGGLVALVVLLLIVTIVSAILATYAWAKYTSTGTGNAVANVAKWNVTFTENNGTFTGTYAHVANTKVAPGTSGTFNVVVNPNNTEVCFTYDITLESFNFITPSTAIINDGKGHNVGAGGVLPDAFVIGTYNNGSADVDVTVAMIKSHILFTYGADADHATTGLTVGDSNSKIHGNYNLGETAHNSISNTSKDATQTIKWTWAYEAAEGASDAQKVTYDGIDTAAGKFADAHGLTFKVDYKIVATQVEPGAASH